MDNATEIVAAKGRIFDILEAQSAYQSKINELEKLKNSELQKLNDLRQQAAKAKAAESKG